MDEHTSTGASIISFAADGTKTETKVPLDDVARKAIDVAQKTGEAYVQQACAARKEAADGEPTFKLATTKDGNLIVKGLDPARILSALYNASRPVGLGFLHATREPMTREEAAKIISTIGLDWDYIKGRPIKTLIFEDEINPWGYDRDNGGAGSCKRVIEREFGKA